MTDLVEAEKLRKERWYILILAAIQFTHILDFVIMMPLGPRFMRVFHITPVEFSALVSSYTFSAGIVGFLGALYADHFDRKKFLLFNFTGFIVGTFFCAISTNFTTLLTARIIAGAFGGVLNAGVLSLASDLIPYQRRGSAMGVIMSAFSVSSVIGVPTGLYIAQAFDWHASFYFICIIGIVFWILAFIQLPNLKIHRQVKGFKENLLNFKSILVQKSYLLNFSLTSILGFGIFGIIPFISPFMVRNIGLTEEQLPLIYLIGGACTIVTARIIGKLCDKKGSFAVFKVTALLSVFPILFLTHLPPGAPLWVALLSTTLFTSVGSGRFIPALTLISATVKNEERGTFNSLENAARQISSGAASQVAGLIVGSTAAGALTNYNIVGYIAAATSIIGIFIAYKIKTNFNLR